MNPEQASFPSELSCLTSRLNKQKKLDGMVEKTECGVRSAEYGVPSAESVSVKVFSLDLTAIFKQTPSFPLYGGIKWKTRSLSLKCFFRSGGDF